MTADPQDRDDDQHLLHGLFEHAPDAIVVVGGNGRIIRANAQVQALFDYGCEEVVGQPIELLVPERYQCPLRGVRRACLCAHLQFSAFQAG